MTQKELLLVDLCARLPYRPKGVKLYTPFDPEDIVVIGYTGRFVETYNDEIPVERVRLYLRPLSSMTEEEKGEYSKLTQALIEEDDKVEYLIRLPNYNTLDWLNAHYLDYRDLIGKGLALPAPKGMYIIK